MEALGARVGLLETRFDGIERQLSYKNAPNALLLGGAKSQADVSSMATAEWVRLFEGALDVVQRRVESCLEEESRTGQRLDRLEGLLPLPLRRQQVGAQSGSGQPTDEDSTGLTELAEMMLSGLREVQQEVRDFCEQASGETLQRGVEFNKEALKLCETRIQEQQSRLQSLEVTVLGRDGHTAAAPLSLSNRLEKLEQESVQLEKVRKHGASLRALDDVEKKIVALQGAVSAVKLSDASLQVSRATANVDEGSGMATAKSGNSLLSTLDSYQIKSNMEQVMLAMEGLVRQRNDDVRLINMQLEEVYAYVQKGMPGQGDNSPESVQALRAAVADLSTRLESALGTQLLEVDRRAAHAAKATSDEVRALQARLVVIEETAASWLKRCAVLEDKTASLTQLSEYHNKAEARREVAASELRREVTSLRVEVGEVGVGSVNSNNNTAFDAKLAIVRSEIEARFKMTSMELSQRLDSWERRLQILLGPGGEGEATSDFAMSFGQELDSIRRSMLAAGSDVVRAEADLRERLACSERELRAEIRATQRLIMEVTERSGSNPQRRSTNERQSGGEDAAPSPMLPITFPQSIPQSALVLDVGTVTQLDDHSVEWRVPDVLSRLQANDPKGLVSPVFQVAAYQQMSLKMKFFPLGSKRRSQVGFCSLYVSGVPAMHLQFTLRLGQYEHGPLECYFDHAEKDHGRHDFCRTMEEADADGSVVVKLVILDAAFVQSK